MSSQQRSSLLRNFSECLVDLEGLLGYCHEKSKLGHYCLYCEKMFPTWQGCQNHMVSKQHTKLRYEQGYWEELDVFYDFKRDNSKFLGGDADCGMNDAEQHDTGDVMDEDDEDGWEDMSQDEEREQEQDEDDLFNGYKKEIARFGLDVTPLGELVFPDGRIVGHRALRRYYKQRVRPIPSSTAIVAAKQAAGERMYEGRVVNINQPMSEMTNAGKGILVSLKDGATGFSVLSLYRYRAAIRKQKRDVDQGRRHKYRTTLNMNRMDKKANNLMNGVSVAHAAR
jgi:pre-60S factor REI1